MDDRFEFEDFFDYYVMPDEQSSVYTLRNEQPVGFYNSIVLKREFSSYRPSRQDAERLLQQRDETYMPHQKFMQKYMSPLTPYNAVLAFHGVGTGKTILYVAITELARKQKPSWKPTLVLLSKAQLIDEAILKIIENQQKYQYKFDEKNDIFELGGTNDLNVTRRDLEAKKKAFIYNKSVELVKQNYKFMTYLEASREIRRIRSLGSTNILQQKFGDRLIVIDEAHHLFMNTDSEFVDDTTTSAADASLPSLEEARSKTQAQKKVQVDKYFELLYMLQNVTNIKVLLLTGTPMRDRPEEIINLLNLILPQPLSRELITSIFNENNEIIPDEAQRFKRQIAGYVSYLRSEENVQVFNMGKVEEPLSREVVVLPMSSIQSSVYVQSIVEDAERSEQGSVSWTNANMASLFVIPTPAQDGSTQFTYGADAESNIMLLYDRSGKRIPWKELAKTKDAIKRVELTQAMKRRLVDESGRPSVDILRLYSTKFAYVIQQLLNHRDQKMYVYTRTVRGGGALMFGALCDLFGISYIIMTGITTKNEDISKLLRPFNDPSNDQAANIQVVIGSSVISEGFDFKSIRKIFILTAFWNDATIDQAIGRGVRSTSHLRLPSDQRNIEIYRLVAVPTLNAEQYEVIEGLSADDKFSLDLYMYRISEEKDRRIKAVERLMKEAAVDCALNRERNVLSAEFDNKRECDYKECNIQCEGVYPWLLEDDQYKENYIVDTWNQHYADEFIEKLQEGIRRLYQLKSTYDFTEMHELLVKQQYPINHILLARAIFDMINMNKPISNRFGFMNFLRSQDNMYFLVDEPLISHKLTSAYYASHPIPIEAAGATNASDKVYIENLVKERVVPRLLDIVQKNPDDLLGVCRLLSSLELNTTLLPKLLRYAFIYYVVKEQYPQLEIEPPYPELAPLYRLLLSRYLGYFFIYDSNEDSGLYLVDLFDKVAEGVQDYVLVAPRCLLVDDLVDQRFDDWVEVDEVTAWVEANIDQARRTKIQELSDIKRNEFRLYLVSDNDPCDTLLLDEQDDAVIKIKDVKVPRLILDDYKDGLPVLIVDKKVQRETGGTNCQSLNVMGLYYRVLRFSKKLGKRPPFFKPEYMMAATLGARPEERLTRFVSLLITVVNGMLNSDKWIDGVAELRLFLETKKFIEATPDLLGFLRQNYEPFKKLSDVQWRQVMSRTPEEYLATLDDAQRRKLKGLSLDKKLFEISGKLRIPLSMRFLQFYDMYADGHLGLYLSTNEDFLEFMKTRLDMNKDRDRYLLEAAASLLGVPTKLLEETKRLLGTSVDAQKLNKELVKYMTQSVPELVSAIERGTYSPLYLYVLSEVFSSTRLIKQLCSELNRWLEENHMNFTRTREPVNLKLSSEVAV